MKIKLNCKITQITIFKNSIILISERISEITAYLTYQWMFNIKESLSHLNATALVIFLRGTTWHKLNISHVQNGSQDTEYHALHILGET